MWKSLQCNIALNKFFANFWSKKWQKHDFTNFWRGRVTEMTRKMVIVALEALRNMQKYVFCVFFDQQMKNGHVSWQSAHLNDSLPWHVAGPRYRVPEICHFKWICSSGKLWNVGPDRFISIGYPLLKLLKIIDFHRFRRFDHQKSDQNKDG